MRIVAWVVEGTWPAVIDAVRTHASADASADAEIVLLHVTDPDTPQIAHGAYAGLLGRGHHERDPGTRLEQLAAAGAAELLAAAAGRLGQPATRIARTGRPEREVVAEADRAGMLILARDGDQTRLGPKSLGRAGRFIIDHAPCPVLVVWPASAPGLSTLPPAPPHRP
jgi:nucleotide-binding universal stress UspA family protein